ncbi:MAG: hypothetical protein ACI8UD_000202 [Planctomycetota bacterium]|jgi:hypothetical protein
MQQGEGIRVTTTAAPGGSITVNVGSADDVIDIGISGSPNKTSFQGSANKDTSIPVPLAPPGSVLVIRVGKGKRRRIFFVTVVAPSP